MIITLLKKERIYTWYLPSTIKGQFWITDKNRRGQTRKILSIEGISGKWHIRNYRSIQVKDPSTNKDIRFAELISFGFYHIILGSHEEPALLFCEKITEGRLNFTKYIINTTEGVNITVGRDTEGIENTIAIKNKMVSRVHCTLQYYQGRWVVRDNNSGNGTFVNNYAISSESVKPGDVIYILGVTIIIGSNFIAVNNPDNMVTFDHRVLRPYIPEITGDDNSREFSEYYEEEVDYFYRSPRFMEELESAQLNIEAPPASPISEEQPLILTLGPSLTMGMMALTMGGFAAMNAISVGNMMMVIPTVIMAFSMLMGAILWPTLARRFKKKKGAEQEKERQEKYRAYLRKMEEKILVEGERQGRILRQNSPSIGECISRVELKSIDLWNRSIEQSDFLHLRVGVGEEEFFGKVDFPKETFTMEKDDLLDEVIAMGNRPKVIQDVPITISLFDNRFTSVIGDRKKCLDFAKGLIIQLTAHYGYDIVKTVFLYDEIEKTEFEYAKWLPHSWDDDKKIRMIASNMNELKEVSAYLEKEIEIRNELNEANLENEIPYYLIFAFSLDLAQRSEVLSLLYGLGRNINFSVISFFDELKNVPKECDSIIELHGNMGKIFNKNDTSGEHIVFTEDISYDVDMLSYSVNLANIFLDVSSSSYQLPKMVTFMEMFGVSNVEHLNASLRWRENDPTTSLQTPIGVNTFGDLFLLDLHEKFHGPHGLVAGTTGSGKSEMIITYILSLALNYHPNEVAFILIDYKGGGMAKAFERLPHVAGIITNLDGSAIKRSLVSINSELKRRQGVFNDASKQLGTRVADIYAYQKEYRNGKVDEPVPHLFIISDEFAELKAQQPEFMTELVSTARIGRSLGVHLILATQKPSGVVDDQIWSNSKFKLSLKVQDRSDSMEMLKRPDAAELTDTGRFYLLVGNNEVFEVGQSAWAGADYAPGAVEETKDVCTISVIDMNGNVVQSVKPEVIKVEKSDQRKQIDVITDYIVQTAEEENVSTRQLWLPPMDEIILLDDLNKEYSPEDMAPFILNPLIGEIDDPAGQRRMPLYVPLSTDGNTIIYGAAGAGKATFITTMVYALLRTHDASTLNLYLVDFGAETLRAFSKAPQVGDVVFSNESEKIGNLLKMIRESVVERKKQFADWGGDYHSYCERSGEIVPNIVIIINNYTNFKEMYYDYEEVIASLIQDCAKYGIYFIFTANNINVSYKLTQNCSSIYTLQLNDALDYSVVGRTEGLFPARLKGRGLVNLGGVYEFQIAHICEPKNITEQIWRLCGDLEKDNKVKRAKSIPILPPIVDPEFFSNMEVTRDRIPIGINKAKLNPEYLRLTSDFITLIIAKEITSTIPFLQGTAELVSASAEIETKVLDISNLFDVDTHKRYQHINQEIEEAITALFELTVERHKAYKREGQTEFAPVTFVIPSFSELCRQLTEESFSKLNALLLRGSADYGLNIIISDTSADISSHTSQEWYQTHCGGNGIWVGDGVSGQYTLAITKQTNELYSEIGDTYGVRINKGKFRIIKLLQSYLSLAVEEDEYE